MNKVFRNVFDIPFSHVFERGKFDPALGFDLSSALPAGITFTRASDGTAFDAAGVLQTYSTDVARFDHDASGIALGLLLEPQSENFLLRSEEFDNPSWTKPRSSVTADDIIAPDGNLTGDKLVEDSTATSTHLLAQNITTTATGSYTYSFFAKAGERTDIVVARATSNITIFGHYYNLVAGTASGPGATIQNFGNGWYRCSGTVDVTTVGSTGVQIRLAIGNTSVYTGDGSSGLYLWGAQFEEGANLTSYIATTSAAVTRAVDSATFSTDLTTSGTILIEHDVPSGDIILGEGANTVLTSTGAGTLAISFDGTRSQSCLNGGSVSSGSGLTLGATLRLLGSSAVQSIGHVKRYQEFDRIMSGAELRQISK
jgi:hypothetical protein